MAITLLVPFSLADVRALECFTTGIFWQFGTNDFLVLHWDISAVGFFGTFYVLALGPTVGVSSKWFRCCNVLITKHPQWEKFPLQKCSDAKMSQFLLSPCTETSLVTYLVSLCQNVPMPNIFMLECPRGNTNFTCQKGPIPLKDINVCVLKV